MAYLVEFFEIQGLSFMNCESEKSGNVGSDRMKFTSAQREFQIRYYRWATRVAMKEVEDSFPSFGLFNGGLSWEIYQFIRRLGKNDQVIFMSGMVKSTHPLASSALGELLNSEERILVARFKSFSPERPASFIVEMRSKKSRAISKRHLQKILTATFNRFFKGQFVMEEFVDGDLRSHFTTRVSGWNIDSHFWFGRRESLLSYRHNIYGDSLIVHPDDPNITAPAMVLARGLHWIWTYPVQWEHISKQDAEPSCHQACEFTRQMLQALPILLDGLNPTTLTLD
jgi:hypothetical protein